MKTSQAAVEARAGEFEAPDGTRRKLLLRRDGLQARLGLTQHRHGSKDAFAEPPP